MNTLEPTHLTAQLGSSPREAEVLQFTELICVAILTEWPHFEETTKMSLEKVSALGAELIWRCLVFS